jgi:hypothetical protein
VSNGLGFKLLDKSGKVSTFRGRFLGIAVLAGIQVINGLIHTFSGLALVLGSYSPTASSNARLIFGVYNLIYGLLTIFFTHLLWKGKRSGWIGTVAVSLFVIIEDTLTVLNLLNVPDILKTAIFGEIPYSACMHARSLAHLLITIYLLQKHVRSKYEINL